MSRPIRATIHAQALRHNLAVARRAAGASRVWSVVKANAYGHGVLTTAQALAADTDGFALLGLDEAQALRQAGHPHPILLLEGVFSAAEMSRAAELGLSLVIHEPRQLAWLESATLGRPLAVCLKFNTGMNRLGFRPSEAPGLLARLLKLPQVADVTLMSHFAEADGEEGIADQLAVFRPLLAASQLPFTLANSAALLRFPDAVCGRQAWVRPGIMLYGASPFPDRQSAAQLGLRPAMTLSSEIIGVQALQAGEKVGYGGLFRADGPMRVGVVACGYADGYPRHAPTGTPVAVAGRRTRTLGRVSMDMLAVDLTDLPEAGVGAPVVLWGGEGDAHIAADEVASSAGTIAYELFCALAPRVAVSVAP